MQISQEQLEAVIRKVLQEQMAGLTKPMEKCVDKKSGILVVKGKSVRPEPFDTGKPGTKVFLSDVMTLEESPRLMAGIILESPVFPGLSSMMKWTISSKGYWKSRLEMQ